MDFARIASRVAKSVDEEEISDEFYHWSSYLDETLKSARVLIGKLETMSDFLDKAGDSPDDKWRRVVALALGAKGEIANDAFIQEAQFMRSKMREWVQKPFYTVSPDWSDQQAMNPALKAQALSVTKRDNEEISRMTQELSAALAKFHSRW